MVNNFEFANKKIIQLINDISKIIIGQDEFIKQLVVAFFSGGNILIEGVPGLAKTLTAKTMAKLIDVSFNRIQFTPDMMPADIIGTKVFDINSSKFYFKKGAVFTNILIADEINRTPPKTQAALLEVMEEHTITFDGEIYKFNFPFVVIATQNPLEYEGTYPLPEAQLDRFMMKIKIDYLKQEFENDLLKYFNNKSFSGFDIKLNDINKTVNVDDIKICKEEISKITVSDEIINYITSIIRATRNSSDVILGASPRASIFLLSAVKTNALIEGRKYVIPEDIKALAAPILRHRIILKPEAEIEGSDTDSLVLKILNKVQVPR
jgi:MoxR-like ATPase